MIYVPALSGLRAVACLAVVLFHSKVAWAGGGYLGVDVFFVLSGYLTVMMLNRRDVSWGDAARFVERRVMRIYPLLVVVCVSVACVLSMTSDVAAVTQELVSTLAFFSNMALAGGGGPDFMIHSWSVSSEMQFYVVIAVIFACIAKVRRAVLLPLFLGLFVVITGLRFLAFYDGDPWPSIYFSPMLRVSGLFLGGAIALLSAGFAARLAPLGWLGLAVVMLAFFSAVHRSAISFTIWSTAVEVATALVILSLVFKPASRLATVLSGKWIELLGLWSYGIYLWHYPIARVLRDETAPEIAAFLTLLISIPLAALSYRYVEERFRYVRFTGVSGARASS
jgi:peptidoglycan/LPS O-acetylase OafA/YrhL